MIFNDVFATIPSEGWLTKPEAELLWHTAQSCIGNILEVGAYVGRSTCLLASLGRRVIVVDPFDGFSSDYTGPQVLVKLINNLRGRAFLHNVDIYAQRIEAWAPIPCGFAYLDGDHTYSGTMNQIVVAKKCGVKRLAVHDIADSGGGKAVKDACIDRLGPWQTKVERMAVWEL